jgi:hypothetical protein
MSNEVIRPTVDAGNGHSEKEEEANDRNHPLSLDTGGTVGGSRILRYMGKTARVLAKTLLYTVFLVAAVVLILLGLEWAAEYALRTGGYGQIYPHNFQMVKRDYTRPVSHYDYDFVPGVCLIFDLGKGNRLEYANNAGFREPRDIPLEKPSDELRIFLTGGSTAFGMGATGEAHSAVGPYTLEYRETISHIMEKILNSTAAIPGKKIRVYNAAVWGYAYQHDFLRYITKLRRYKPDMIVSLDGANEIALVSKITPDWDYFKEGQYSNIWRQVFSYNGAGLSSYLTLWLKNNTYLMSALWAGRDTVQELSGALLDKTDSWDSQGSEPYSLKISVEERSKHVGRNVAEVMSVVEKFDLALKNDGVAHIFALQPWFYLTKKPLQEQEKALMKLQGAKRYYGLPSDQMYQFLIERIVESAKRNQYFVADFSRYFDDVSERVFTDWCHLTAGANYLLAKELSNLVKEHFFKQPLSAGDRIGEKDTYFWDLAASGKIFYAPPPDSPENSAKNMVQGYPSPALYSSKPVGPKEKLEVVLDLGRVEPVSRMRIVWADKTSVPKKWVVEWSVDRTDWKTLVRSENAVLDSLSRWPGFEYYGAEPVKARYLRYRPVGTKERTMKLRLWSVAR